MEFQIRNYWIKPGSMDQFLDVWKNGVVPLRKQAGFKVLGSWVNRVENRFTWIVGFDGPGTFDQAYRAYMDSPGRKSLNPDPASLLAKSDVIIMTQVLSE